MFGKVYRLHEPSGKPLSPLSVSASVHLEEVIDALRSFREPEDHRSVSCPTVSMQAVMVGGSMEPPKVSSYVRGSSPLPVIRFVDMPKDASPGKRMLTALGKTLNGEVGGAPEGELDPSSVFTPLAGAMIRTCGMSECSFCEK
jgi:hypothetical protein